MFTFRIAVTAFFVSLTAMSHAVSAQVVYNEDVEINGELTVSDNALLGNSLCLGTGCHALEVFSLDDTLRIKSPQNTIEVVDTSASGFDRDWVLRFNDDGMFGYERFAIEDVDAGTIPFSIEGGAPNNALWLDDSGRLGLGTTLPQKNLHIISSDVDSVLRLQETVGPHSTWDLRGNSDGFNIWDAGASTVPFNIEDGASNYSIRVTQFGDIGLGTFFPAGKLHTYGNGVQLAYFESGDGGPVQVRFRTNSENRRFLAVNNANEVKSQIIFKDNEIQFTGATDSGANRWLTIGPAGIVSQGPSCNPGPCDATFDPSVFDIPTIKDHAAFMWENSHLQAVGPTGPDIPMNLTEKIGGMLHELELAHIYIDQQNNQITRQVQEIDDLHSIVAGQASMIADLEARLSALETR